MRNFIKISICIVFCLGLFALRAHQLQKKHFGWAKQDISDGMTMSAVRDYDSAMHMYVPFSAINEKSAEALFEIAGAYEKSGDTLRALIAYSSLRSSLYSARSFYTPGSGWIKKCNKKIASLNVKILFEEGAVDEKGADKETQRYINASNIDRSPDIGWSIASVVFFGIWVVSLVLLAARGFENNGTIVKVRFAFYLTGFVFAFSLWALSLYTA